MENLRCFLPNRFTQGLGDGCSRVVFIPGGALHSPLPCDPSPWVHSQPLRFFLRNGKGGHPGNLQNGVYIYMVYIYMVYIYMVYIYMVYIYIDYKM